MNPLLVYVVLGKNYDELLNPYSDFASVNLKHAQRVLVTDNPKVYQDFQGDIVLYRRSERTRKTMDILKNSKPNLVGKAGDYWFLTFERLLALQAITEAYPSSTPVLHLEGDILSFINLGIFDLFRSAFQNATILRWREYANAGVAYFPNCKEIDFFVENLHREVELGGLSDSWTIDMQILRSLLDKGLVSEFPTVIQEGTNGQIILSSDHVYKNARIVCDSLDLGVYLLGRNSVYSKGIVSRGYRYEHIPWRVEETWWMLEENVLNDKVVLNFKMKFLNEEFFVPFIHVNSKINLLGNGISTLAEFFPVNQWVTNANFPKKGVRSPSVHKEPMTRALLKRFKRLIGRL